MRKLNSNITNLVQRAGKLLQGQTRQVGCAAAPDVGCEAAHELMSPFIDSMATPEEVAQLQLHLNACEPCQRQLQAFISIRSLLTRMGQPSAPEDSVLNVRVKLSQARNTNTIARIENRLSDLLRPIAIPAIAGVSLTMLLFGVLLGALISNTTVMAHDRSDDRASVLYRPVRTTNLTMIRLASSDAQTGDEPLMIETHVGDTGKVLDYKIISGPETPEIEKWIREQFSLAEFTPATAFGRPVDSKIILSFVLVKS